MSKHHEYDNSQDFIPAEEVDVPKKVTTNTNNKSKEYIPIEDAPEVNPIPSTIEAPQENTPILNRDYILPASENDRPSAIFWSILISLVCIIILMIFRSSIVWFQRLSTIGVGLSIFYTASLLTLLISLSVFVFRIFRDYMLADDGSELAMVGATLNVHSEQKIVVEYAQKIAAKYKDHRLETVRNGAQALNARMQFTINKSDILEEIRKGILVHIDEEVEKLISNTAQQTLWGTAISPVVSVDMAIVTWRTIGMVRDIAALYGYRPGFTGSLRLLSRILSTIAFTGISDLAVGTASNLIGNALLTRLSATLTHAFGVGILTIRIGIAASVNCRPLPFQKGELSNYFTLLYNGIKNILMLNFTKEESPSIN